MKVSREKLMREAQSTGFRPEVLEKGIHLLNLLEGFNRHPFLKERLALKGGTALNLFLSEVPRLSVDIDLNYIGAADYETLMKERPQVEEAVRAVCLREGMQITRTPSDHAGGKWLLRYGSAEGAFGNLEVDLNFMYRTPLWPVAKRDAQIGSFSALQVVVLDLHELAAGKLVALLARQASRDLFDAHQLLQRGDLDRTKLRLGFVVYGAMNRKDWRTVKADDVGYDRRELENQLTPVVRRDFLGANKPSDWVRQMIDGCLRGLEAVLPLTDEEMSFLDQLLEHGRIEPERVTSDPDMMARISRHPLLAWKAQNVRKHKEIVKEF